MLFEKIKKTLKKKKNKMRVKIVTKTQKLGKNFIRKEKRETFLMI